MPYFDVLVDPDANYWHQVEARDPREAYEIVHETTVSEQEFAQWGHEWVEEVPLEKTMNYGRAVSHQYSVQMPNERYVTDVTISLDGDTVEMQEDLRRGGRPAGGNIAVWEFVTPDAAKAFASEVTKHKLLINRAVHLAEERGGKHIPTDEFYRVAERS